MAIGYRAAGQAHTMMGDIQAQEAKEAQAEEAPVGNEQVAATLRQLHQAEQQMNEGTQVHLATSPEHFMSKGHYLRA